MRRRLHPDVVHDQELVFLPRKATARAAARLMAQKHVSSVLVIEDDKLLGIVTVRDIARRVVGEGRNADRTHLSAIMTANPTSVSAEDTPMTALSRMKDGGFRHLPIMHNGRVIGLVVRSDFSTEEAQCLEFEESLWQNMR